RVWNSATRSGGIGFLKEIVQAARDNGGDHPSIRTSNVLEGVPAAARREHGSTRAGIDLLSVYFEPVLALEDVPRFILVPVEVQRRTMKRPGPPFENGEGPSRIAARNLDCHLIAADVDRLAIASFHNYGGPMCIRGNWHSICPSIEYAWCNVGTAHGRTIYLPSSADGP